MLGAAVTLEGVTEPYEVDAGLHQRLSVLKERFRPSAPVNTQDLFKGRVEQLSVVFDVVTEVGNTGSSMASEASVRQASLR